MYLITYEKSQNSDLSAQLRRLTRDFTFRSKDASGPIDCFHEKGKTQIRLSRSAG